MLGTNLVLQKCDYFFHSINNGTKCSGIIDIEFKIGCILITEIWYQTFLKQSKSQVLDAINFILPKIKSVLYSNVQC